VRLTTAELEDHVAGVALLLERFGVDLDLGTPEELVLQRSSSGVRWFAFRGFLPGERHSAGSIVGLREIWRPTNGEHLEAWVDPAVQDCAVLPCLEEDGRR